VRWFLTARDGVARLTEQTPLTAEGQIEGPARVLVNAGRRFQVMEGFGAAFTEAAAVTWQQLGPAHQQQVLRDCFSRTEGHGYTLCRVHMNSCDFALGNYAHVSGPTTSRSTASASSATGRHCCPSSGPPCPPPGRRCACSYRPGARRRG